MIKMVLLLDEQEKITLKRCLSIFVEQAQEKMFISDEVEIQTAQGMLDSVLAVETEEVEEVVKKLTNKLKEAMNEDYGTNNPNEPRTSYERDEPA
jgi:hypothetical protein|tara:strand:+ start:259 stop:543 length:285 start_codon:yes stop_codon:yes gene_type:complete